MNVPEDYDDDNERDCTAWELLPETDTSNTDLCSVRQTIASQTMPVTRKHCRSVLGNDRTRSRSILGATGQLMQEKYKKMRSVRWAKKLTHVRIIAVE
jgi:hypothetical protein